MRRYIRWIVGLALLGFVAHSVTVWAVPRVIMFVTMRKLARPEGVNHEVHAPPATESSRTVVMPSPDLLYTTCVFDISAGPVEVSAQVPSSYWSVALYASNSDNFFVVNDRNAPASGIVRLMLTKDPLQSTPQNGVLAVIPPPTTRGIVLFRTLVESADRLPEMQAAQQSMTCRSLTQ